ncbi:MAG: hypothetical protein ABFR32_07060 [Bacteroidota bacterium]
MASIKDLKKNINFVLSDVIEECYVSQLSGDTKNNAKIEKIIDEAISTFDELIVKVNEKNVENKAKHFKSINADLESKAHKLLVKLEKLNV